MTRREDSPETVFDVEFDHAHALTRDAMLEVDKERVAEIAGVDVDDVDRIVEAFARAEYERRPHRDPNLLRHLYYRKGMTQRQIADELDTAQRPIGKWMRRHGIAPGRGRGPVWNTEQEEPADD